MWIFYWADLKESIKSSYTYIVLLGLQSHCLQKGPYFKDQVLNKNLFDILGP